MTMTVRKTSGVNIPTVFLSNNGKVADIAGGVSVKTSELVNGNYLPDGSALGRASSGICSVCKSAKVLTGSTTTAIKVTANTNPFVVGDKIFYGALNGKHYAITAIAVADGVATITVGTAIDTPTAGGFIYENADVADGDTGSALKVSPVSLTGTSMYVDTTSNMAVDAWVQGAVKYGEVGDVILDAMATNRSYFSEV